MRLLGPQVSLGEVRFVDIRQVEVGPDISQIQVGRERLPREVSLVVIIIAERQLHVQLRTSLVQVTVELVESFAWHKVVRLHWRQSFGSRDQSCHQVRLHQGVR